MAMTSIVSRIRSRDELHESFGTLEGAAARRERIERTRRRILGRVVVALSAILLALILFHLREVDARGLVQGPGRNVLLVSLVADVAACLLIVVGRMRSGSHSRGRWATLA